MSETKGVKIEYKGNTLINFEVDGEMIVNTKGSYMEDDLTVEVNRDAEVGEKAITSNGSYNAASDNLDGYSQITVNVPNSYVSSDEGKVVNNGTLIEQTSATKTENGTYDTTLISALTVNVESSAVILTRQEWKALTTAQKQAYGLICIQDYLTGFNRGEFVNGAEYIPLDEFLPFSDYNKIVCSAHKDNFDGTASWGDGIRPVTLDGTLPTQAADDSVYIKTKTDGTLAYVDLGETGKTFTAYIVGKIALQNGSYTRLLCALESRSSGKGIMLFGTNDIKVSSWVSDTATGVSGMNYFVGVIQYVTGIRAKGSVISSAETTPTFISKTPSTAGRYVTIGRSDITSGGSNIEPTDTNILFFGVVEDAETETVMAQNMQYLAQQFLG